ncbi:mucin-3B [Parasteatoda tepidariorum]|uniref:mucin-3B n=1 Tax=Parasteatoda tepidariorum TaxID=114398 RepID=UPI00077FB5A1|nr:mucin-17 [Parasteatoda tepidariorum]
MDYTLLKRILFKEYNIYIVCGLVIGLLCVQADSARSLCNQKTQFPCRTTPHICIKLSQVRDGRLDCPDGSDEECPDNMHRCMCGIPKCIKKNKVGDGIRDCQDGSDEGENGFNFLCPETYGDDDPFSIEVKKRRRRGIGLRNDPIVYPSGIISAFIGTEVNGDQTTYHTTQLYRTYIDGTYTELLQSTSAISPTATGENVSGMEATAHIHRFGSLHSGTVYLTAVNEPISSLSSSMVETDAPIEVSGTFIPPTGDMKTKHFGLDISARTIGTIFPDKTQTSIIVVTGTEGVFVHKDRTSEVTYPMYTGSYVSGLEDPTTYKFFFGNQPLTSDVRVILPTKSFNMMNSIEYSTEDSNLFEPFLRRNDFDIDEDFEEDNIAIEAMPEPQYITSEYSSKLYASIPTLIPEMKPLAITRYVQPSTNGEVTKPVLAMVGENTVGVIGNVRQPQTGHTLRGHQGYSRQGRMLNPTPSGRRVGQGGATIITDQFFFPGHRVETSVVGDVSNAYNKDLNNAYYNVNNNLNDQLRKFVRPSVVKDKRLTRTVGLYGPIYEVDDLKNGVSSTTTNDESEAIELKSSADETGEDFTTTLYGFAEFSTRISGTHYVFLPASTRPRTFTPRVTRTSFTNGLSAHSRSQSSDVSDNHPDAFFREPLFGTDTREFISQKSMFTSTVNEPIEIKKTMLTSTVMTKQYSDDQLKARKIDETPATVVAETWPLNLETVYTDANGRIASEKDILINLQPLSKNTLMSENSLELDVSEVVDNSAPLEETDASLHPTGLVSSITGTEVVDGTTTHWKTLIYGTYIDDTYAHIIESTSSIFFTVSKTASPEETLAMETVISYNNERSEDLNEDSNTDSSEKEVKIFSSLTDISSKGETPSKDTSGFSSSATPSLEILTSGFILPGNKQSTESASVIGSVPDSSFIPSLVTSTNSPYVTPEVVYEESLSSALSETITSDSDVGHILTDSFFLPMAVEIAPSKINNNDEEMKTEDTVSTEENRARNLRIDDLDKQILGITSSPRDSYSSVDKSSSQVSKDISDSTSSLENSVAEKSEPVSPSVVLLTGNFFLPGMSSEEVSNHKEEMTDAISDSSPDNLKMSDMKSISETPSIITDGFILPAAEPPSSDSPSLSTVQALPSSALLIAEESKDENNFENEARSAGEENKIIILDNEIKPTSISLNDDVDKVVLKEGISSERSGKALSVSMEEILPSVSFPITYFTTSTYFTTYHSGGSTIVSSRKETVSNVYTDSEELKSARLSTTVEVVDKSHTISPTSTLNPNDDLTTFTYYTTFYKDGSKVVSSREETSSDDFNDVSTNPEIKSSYSILTYPTTYYTTLTYFTTLIQDSSTKIITSEAIVSNVVTPSIDNDLKTHSVHETELPISVTETGALPTTYFTTYTYYTTFHKDGTTSVSTTFKTVSSVLRGSDDSIQSTPVKLEERTDVVSTSDDLRPTTYFTTFTYYTTFLHDGTQVVSSREEVVSSITSLEATKQIDNDTSSVTVSPDIQKTTFYTTYTYYTTLLKSGTTSVVTRKDTISNVLDGNIRTSISATVAPTTISSADIKATPIVKTHYTTYTYYTTYLRDGSSVISTREDTLTNFVTESPLVSKTSIITPTRSFTTYYTTLTSYYTLYNGGTPSVNTVFRTLTDVVALSSSSYSPSHSTPELTTYYKTHTFTTTLEDSPTPVVSERKQITSRVVTLGGTKEPITIAHAVTAFRSHDSPDIQPTSVLTKTFYTTYTYLTTYLYRGQPSVSTRFETSTNYATETIALNKENSQIFPSSTESPISVSNTISTNLPSESNSVKESTYHTVSENTDPLPLDIVEPITTVPSSNTLPLELHTVYTTFTYYTTLITNGSPTINTRYETSTNVAAISASSSNVEIPNKATSDLDAAEGGFHESRVHPTPVVTYFTTHTYIATSINPEGETKYVTREVVASATVEPKLESEVSETSTLPCCAHTTQYPYTFYTTYTYYTTRFHGDRPIINTRYETITNVIKAPPNSDERETTSFNSIGDRITPTTIHSSVLKTSAPSPTALFNPGSIPNKIDNESLKLEIKEIEAVNSEEINNLSINNSSERNNIGNEILDKNRQTVTTEKISTEFPADSVTVETSSLSSGEESSTSTEDTLDNTHSSTEEARNSSKIIENATLSSSDETSTTIISTTESPKKSIFARRRNRPTYKPRPSFRSSTSLTTTTTTARTTQRGRVTARTTTTRSPIAVVRRNTSRVLFRRPSPRPNPLQRLRPLRTTQEPSTDSDPDNSSINRRKRSFFDANEASEPKPRFRKLLSTNDDITNDEISRNNDLISGGNSLTLDKKNDETEGFKIGLLRSMDSKVINNGVVTVYGTEIHGTFVNGVYAQVVHSKVSVYSEAPNEIEKTPLISSATVSPNKLSTSEAKKVGLVSSRISTAIKDGITTVYTTNTYGTYIGEVYAHLAQTTSSIIKPTPSSQIAHPTGLISSILRTEENYGTTTLWTTQIYGTFVNNYYAHIASTMSNTFVGGENTQATPMPPQFQNQVFTTSLPNSKTDYPTGRSVDEFKGYKTGLLSSIVSIDENDGTTTQYITNIFGTYIGEHFAKHAKTTSKIIAPTTTESATRSIGLLSTIVSSVVNQNTATIYKTEILGTYIGQHYAQLARTSTEYKIIPSTPALQSYSVEMSQKTGLISSSVVRSEVNLGTTTMHINEIYGTYIGNDYAHIAKSTSKVIKPTENKIHSTATSENLQKTGLISSSVKTEVNEGTTTLHISEVHGTFVGNYYAHVARRTSTVLPFTPSATKTTDLAVPFSTNINNEGLISSDIRTEENQGTTTLHTREVYGTYINGFYAHVARSTSNILSPTSTSALKTGLVSAITSSEINYGTLTLHTTEIYGTRINGFYAHVARSTSNIVTNTPTPILPTEVTGVISATTSTELNYGITTLHEITVIGKETDGSYIQSIKRTSTVLPVIFAETVSPLVLEHTNFVSYTDSKFLNLGSAKDDLNTGIVNELDNGHQYVSLTEDGDLGIKSSISLPELDLVSSIKLESTSDLISNQINTTLSMLTIPSTLVESREVLTPGEIPTKSKTIKTSPITETNWKESTLQTKHPEKSSTLAPDEYEEYNEYVENKAYKDSVTQKPNSVTEEKSKTPPISSSRNTDLSEEYDDYGFEDDYDNFGDRKANKKVTPSLSSTRFKNTRQSKSKTSSYGYKDYNDYDDYEFDDNDEASSKSSRSTDTSKETPSSSVRIRPFAGRGRPTFTTTSRPSTRPAYTIQFRRPSRTRNSRAFGQRSDSENDFDDDLNEDEEEGDIEASEAVVTTATPQVLSFNRRKPFGSNRQQSSGRNSAPSTTSRPVALSRNRRPFGRSSTTSPSPTPSLKEIDPDYEENTTEDDDFDDYEDINEKKEANRNRNFRSSRRPSSRTNRYGERRSASNKRGSFRHREDEETENDDFDATTPNYRNSRNRINQRKPSRGRHNRNNSPSLKASFNSVNRDEEEDSQSLQPLNRLRNNNRNRRPSYNPRTRRPSKTASETETLRKPFLTVTSVVTTVKTLPIYHGFRTSYATLTTTALDTSVINPTQYSEVISDGFTKTLFYSRTGYPDGVENLHTTITEVIVTTTSLESVKLVPIKIGYSTRTDTITDIQVLTTLSTLYSTITPEAPLPTAFPQQFQPNFYPQIGPPNPDYGLVASANSFITTQIVTSTTVVPIILRGRTILSTLTTTSTAESTVVQTVHLPPSAPNFIPQPYFAFQPLTTLITLYVTGEYGELKPVVTTVTVPLYQQPVFHTKVARSLQNVPSDQTLNTADIADINLMSSISRSNSKDEEIDTHYDQLLSSGLEEINDLSEVNNANMQTDPLDSTRFSKIPNAVTSYDVTTISKGPLTEIYEQKVTINLNPDEERGITEGYQKSKDMYGLESSYSFRKLQQFVENEPLDYYETPTSFRPQRDFTRLRRPPAGVILATAANPDTITQPYTQSIPVRNRGQQLPPSRRPPTETTNDEFLNSNPRTNFRETYARGPLRQPDNNFRPFLARPVPSNSDNELINIRNTYSPVQPTRPSPPVEELVRIRYANESPINSNTNALNRFEGSSPDEESFDGFRPISDPRELRRGPGPAVEDDASQPDSGYRPRRLRITRPANSLIVPSSGVRRITRLRTTTSVPSVVNEEVSITPTLSYSGEEARNKISSREPETASEDAENNNEDSSTSDETSVEADENGSKRTIIRRLRPSFVPGDGSGPRRPVVIRRTKLSEQISSSIPPTHLDSSISVTPVESSDVTTQISSSNPYSTDEDDEESNEFSKPPLKKIVRLRKPENNEPTTSGQRRRVVISRKPSEASVAVPNTLQGRGPISPSDEVENKRINSDSNHIMSGKDRNLDDFNGIAEDLNDSKESLDNALSLYATKPLPLTYYTTLTYFTTFLHGPNKNYVSREAVFSNIIDQTLNPSLINAIKSKNGVLSTTGGDGLLHLASRTLGDTTTIVNLASKQNVYNSDIFQLVTDLPVRESPSSSIYQPFITASAIVEGSNNLQSTYISDLASLPKTYLTLFTYSYTFYDGTNTRQSTRAETMTKLVADPSQFLTENIDSTINSNGVLSILPGSRTVHLGSREVEGTTTEVNLGLRTWIKFDGLKNIAIARTRSQTLDYITPTRTILVENFNTAAPSLETPFSNAPIDPSYSIDNELYDSRQINVPVETKPLHPSEFTDAPNVGDLPKSVVKVTSVIHKPGGPLRSGVYVPRPGVRVRVKPVVSRRLVPSDLASSFDFSFDVNELATEYPESYLSSPQYIPPGLDIGSIRTPVLDDTYVTTVFPSDSLGNEVATEDYEEMEEVTSSDGTVVPTRKKLKVTVRRQSESISRTHTRFVLPSRFEITSRPRFYVVTRTGALGVVSNTQRPFTVKISRKVKPSATEFEGILPSTTVIYDTYTTLTSVPVIFGLDTSYRNVILTTSSPITVSFVPTTAYESNVPLVPSTVVYTYFTTTTFTIPYIDGDETVFTTLEETNSRIVTTTLDGIDTLSYSTVTRTPPVDDVVSILPITSVEFGFDGPTTHTLAPVPYVPTYKNVPPEIAISPTTTVYETKTFYTTYTFFSTFLAGTEPIVTSSEQVVTNVVTVPLTTKELRPSTVSPQIVGPQTVVDTSESVITKTEYNTITFYATLFSDTSSFVTPIQEVETNVKTITETYTITRTIDPSSTSSLLPTTSKFTDSLLTDPSVVVTQTLYTTFTNFVTLFQGSETVVTNLEETVSNVVTLTVPAHAASSFTVSSTPSVESKFYDYVSTPSLPLYTTKEVLSTQTHYLTLFNNDESILSSIIEVVTSYVTEPITSTTTPSFIYENYNTVSPAVSVPVSSATFSTESYKPYDEIFETTSEVQTYHPELVPSIRTIYSTLTFYTTYYRDTSSIVASQEEILTSFITLFVPPSLVTTTATAFVKTETPQPTSTIDPSVFVFTTTDYSTLTLYTTLFSGDEIVVISSEHVVPEIITATITPSSIAPTETTTTDESILTFLTTFTYYTTYFSGTDPVIASSESVVTQFVTIEAPSTSLLETIESTPVDETILGVSTVSGSEIVSSLKEDLSDIQIIGVSSVIATAVASAVETKIEVASEVHSEIGPTSLSTPSLSSKTEDVISSIYVLSSSMKEDAVELKLSTSTDSLLPSVEGSESENVLLPVTSTSLVTEETEVIGINGQITKLVPSDTLVVVTGTDGFVTKIPEIDAVALSPIYTPKIEEHTETTSSEIKPATVIELSDLLGGNTALGGDFGLTIQDIVSRITGKKNKTDSESLTTETTTSESTTENQKQTESTTESSNTTPEKSLLENITEVGTTLEGEFRDSDYPVFVLPGQPENETDTSTTEVLAPVYVPPTKHTDKESSEVMESSSDTTASQSKKTATDKSLVVSTSVITGARTVFILPTKTSTTESTKSSSRDTASEIIEARIPNIEPMSETEIESSMSSEKSTIRETPTLKPSIGTSIVSGIRTVFFGSSGDKDASSKSTTNSITGRVNSLANKPKPFTTVTKDGQTVVSRTTSGATTIFFPGNVPKYTVNPISTRYVTSIESITRTLALTTTRTYYTRDSTLTVPSVYTTTIPPRTFVSTIIGSRTILGILPEPSETVQIHRTIQPSEHTTTVTTTTLIFNSIPSTVIRTLVLPTNAATKSSTSESHSSSQSLPESDVFSAGTETPAKPPEVGDSTVGISEENDLIVSKGPQKSRDESYLRAAGPRLHDYRPDVILEEPAHRPPIVVTESSKPEDDPFLNGRNGVCDPKCQPYKKEVCKEENGFWSCQCRPGHARRNDHEICKEIQTFVVLLKVVKMGNESIQYSNSLADNGSPEYKEFVRSAIDGIADAYSITNVRDHVLDAEVNGILPVDVMEPNSFTTVPTIQNRGDGVIVNFTLQVSKSVSGDLLEQELTRALQTSSMRVGDSSLLAAPLSQNVQDYDECLNFRQNDCALRATCVNLEGTFTCECHEGFEDMDLSLPGRTCLAKTENCNFCHGRGDCLRDDEDRTFCRCQPMFVGRRCEINGLVLAIALPTAVALVAVLLCFVLCCCRKCKKKSSTNNTDPSSVFRGIALKGPVGGTLDRKAMIDTSSESSGEHGRKGIPFEGYQESGDVTPYKGSKRSDLSLNRSLSTGYTSPPVMIPRARQPPQTPGGKPMNYTVYDGQVYVW